MRKLLVMTISLTLLIISSVPMSAAAVACAVPVHNRLSAEIAADIQSGHGMYAEHEHGMALNNDWQHDRIECGCGCHNSIDSLPQLLAPHMTSDSIQMTDQLADSVANQPEKAWLAAAVRVPLPPPQYR
jgi:hypothetical protein